MSKKEVLLILDEVQKIKGWSEVLKGLWDKACHENKNIQVIVLSSASLLIQKGLTESLTGRFFYIVALIGASPKWPKRLGGIQKSVEVDFVVKSPQNVYGVEVKSGKSQRLLGMSMFQREYPHMKPIVIGPGHIEFEAFFSTNPAEVFI